jgi:hypothetical protein
VSTKRRAGAGKANPTNEEPPKPVRRNGLVFDIPRPGEPLPEEARVEPVKPKRARSKPVATAGKADPELAAKARELRDKYLESIDPSMMHEANGKYDVSRIIEASTIEPTKQLAA